MPTTTVTDRFLALLRPRPPRNPDRVTEDHDYVAMMYRQIRALEARAIGDPALLTQVVALAQRLAEVPNVVIATSSERYALDPALSPSMAECARLLGVTKQSASERRARGEAVIAARLAAADAVRFSEAARERAAISSATDHAVTSLADYRARHSAA